MYLSSLSQQTYYMHRNIRKTHSKNRLLRLRQLRFESDFFDSFVICIAGNDYLCFHAVLYYLIRNVLTAV